MKKSTYEKVRSEHHARLIGPSAYARSNRVQIAVLDDIEAAEAAGVVWDPETEPLPERMFLGDEGALFAGTAMTAETRVGYVYDDGDYIAIGKEAVRRYNLFPRIVAVLSRIDEPNLPYRQLIAEALQIAEEKG